MEHHLRMPFNLSRSWHYFLLTIALGERVKREKYISNQSCRFDCQHRMLKTCPGPGYLRSEMVSLSIAFVCKFAYR